jgi:hypothetical protein
MIRSFPAALCRAKMQKGKIAKCQMLNAKKSGQATAT